jgi:hypothetical protein
MKNLILLLLFIPLVISCTKDPIIYTLTTSANPADGGSISPSTSDYESGEIVNIIASPNSKYVFDSWSGTSGSSKNTTVTMSSDKVVVANFKKKKFSLTINVEGEGTVSEKVIKAGAATDYTIDSVIELTAKPSDEWLFVEWSGDLTGTDNPIQITIDKAKNVTAVFVKKQYPLTVEIEGEGTVTEKIIKAGAATDYNSGTIVELTASANNEGWEFKEWTGDLESTENPIEITIDASKAVKAVFVKKQFAVNITIVGENGEVIDETSGKGGTVSRKIVSGQYMSENIYQYGTELELTANPAIGWTFIEWKEDLNGIDNPQQITVTSTKKITAVFKPLYNLSIDIEGSGKVEIKLISGLMVDDRYLTGSVLELKAIPFNSGEVFVEWLEDLEGVDYTTQITLDNSKKVKAVFKDLMIAIPDDNFEQRMIDCGYDNQKDNEFSMRVALTLTKLYGNVSTVTPSEQNCKIDRQGIIEWAGLEEFKNLRFLDISENFKEINNELVLAKSVNLSMMDSLKWINADFTAIEKFDFSNKINFDAYIKDPLSENLEIELSGCKSCTVQILGRDKLKYLKIISNGDLGENSVEVSNLYALETINLSKFSNLEDFNFEKLDYIPLLKCIIVSQMHLDNIDTYENISDQLKSLFALECN